jgi:hypothetical protein
MTRRWKRQPESGTALVESSWATALLPIPQFREATELTRSRNPDGDESQTLIVYQRVILGWNKA